jgi:hypothetical protein
MPNILKKKKKKKDSHCIGWIGLYSLMGNSSVSQQDRPSEGVKNYNIYVCFDKMSVKCCTMCVVCSKVNFITNITNSTRIHTFYFYNNKYTFINTDTTFITKHINFIKINSGPLA